MQKVEALRIELATLQQQSADIQKQISKNTETAYKADKLAKKHSLKQTRAELEVIRNKQQDEIAEDVKLLSLTVTQNDQVMDKLDPENQFAASFERFVKGDEKARLLQELNKEADRDKQKFIDQNNRLKIKELQILVESLIKRNAAIQIEIDQDKALEKKYKDEMDKEQAKIDVIDGELRNLGRQKEDQETSQRAKDIEVQQAFQLRENLTAKYQADTRVIDLDIMSLKAFNLSVSSRGGPDALQELHYIMVDGQRVDNVSRGVCIAILDAYTGQKKHFGCFDTHMTPQPGETMAQQAIRFLNSYKENEHVLAVIVVDEMSDWGNAFANHMRAHFGSTRVPLGPGGGDWRRPWAYIRDRGVKFDDNKEPLEVAVRSYITQYGVYGLANITAVIENNIVKTTQRIDHVTEKKEKLTADQRALEVAYNAEYVKKDDDYKAKREQRLVIEKEILRFGAEINAKNIERKSHADEYTRYEKDRNYQLKEIATKEAIQKGYAALQSEYEKKIRQVPAPHDLPPPGVAEEIPVAAVVEEEPEKNNILSVIKMVEDKKLVLQNTIFEINSKEKELKLIREEIKDSDKSYRAYCLLLEKNLKEKQHEIKVKEDEIQQELERQYTDIELDLTLRGLVVAGYKANKEDNILKNMLLGLLPNIYEQFPEYPLTGNMQAIIPKDLTGTLNNLYKLAWNKMKAFSPAGDVDENQFLKQFYDAEQKLFLEIVNQTINEEYAADNISIKTHVLTSFDGLQVAAREESNTLNVFLCQHQNDFVSVVNRSECSNESEAYDWAKHLMKLFVYNDNSIINDFLELHFNTWAKEHKLTEFKNVEASNLVNYYTEIDARLALIKNFSSLIEFFKVDNEILKASSRATNIYKLLCQLRDHMEEHAQKFSSRQYDKLLSFVKKGFASTLLQVIQFEINRRNKLEDNQIAYNQDPIKKFEKLLAIKQAELEVLQQEMTKEECLLKDKEREKNILTGEDQKLQNSREAQVSDIKSEIAIKETKLKSDKIVFDDLAQKIEGANASKHDAEKIIGELKDVKDKLIAEKQKLDEDLARANEEVTVFEMKRERLEGRLAQDNHEKLQVSNFKTEEEVKLKSSYIQLAIVKLFRFLLSSKINDKNIYDAARIAVLNTKALDASAREKFTALITELSGNAFFNLLVLFSKDHDIEKLIVGLGDGGEKFKDELGDIYVQLAKIKLNLTELMIEPVIFSQTLDIIVECTRKPEIMPADKKIIKISASEQDQSLDSVCEIRGFNLYWTDINQLLFEEINNRLVLLGLNIPKADVVRLGENVKQNILTVADTGAILTFNGFPKGLKKLIDDKIEIYYPRVNGDWPEKAADVSKIQSILTTLNIQYDEVLRAYFSDIVLIAGNDIYLDHLDEVKLAGVSLTLQADSNIYMKDSYKINTSGHNANEYKEAKARDANQRPKVDSAYMEYFNRTIYKFYDNDLSKLPGFLLPLKDVLLRTMKDDAEKRAFKEEGWPTGADGEKGLHGQDGQNAGNVCLRARRGVIENLANLQIDCKGGKGANGQSGGKGDEGKMGYGTPDAYARDTDGMGPRQMHVAYARKAGEGPNNEYRKEEIGGKGGKGGDAGLRGRGGLQGQVVLEDSAFFGDIAIYQQNIHQQNGAPGDRNGDVGSGGEGGKKGHQGVDMERYKRSFWNKTEEHTGRFDDSVLANPHSLNTGGFKVQLGGDSARVEGPNELNRAQLIIRGFGEPLTMIKTVSEVRNQENERNGLLGENGDLARDEREQQQANRNLANENQNRQNLNRQAAALAQSQLLQQCMQQAEQKLQRIHAEVKAYEIRIEACEQRIAKTTNDIADNANQLQQAKVRRDQIKTEHEKVNELIASNDDALNIEHKQYANTIAQLFELHDQFAEKQLEMQKLNIDKNVLESLQAKLQTVFNSLNLILRQKIDHNTLDINSKKSILEAQEEKLGLIQMTLAEIEHEIALLKAEQDQSSKKKRLLDEMISKLKEDRKKVDEQKKEEVKLLMDHQLPRSIARFADLQYMLDEYEPVVVPHDNTNLFTLEKTADALTVQKIKLVEQSVVKYRDELRSPFYSDSELQKILNIREIELRYSRFEFCVVYLIKKNIFDSLNLILEGIFRGSENKFKKASKLEELDEEYLQAIRDNIDTIYPLLFKEYKDSPVTVSYDVTKKASTDGFDLDTHRICQLPSEFDLFMQIYNAKNKESSINSLLHYLGLFYPDLLGVFQNHIKRYAGLAFNLANFLTFLYKMAEEFEVSQKNPVGEVSREHEQQYEKIKHLIDMIDAFYLSGNKKSFRKLYELINLYSKKLKEITEGKGSALALLGESCPNFISFVQEELRHWEFDEATVSELDHLTGINKLLSSLSISLQPYATKQIQLKDSNLDLIKAWENRYDALKKKYTKEGWDVREIDQIVMVERIHLHLGNKDEHFQDVLKVTDSEFENYLKAKISDVYIFEDSSSLFDAKLQAKYDSKFGRKQLSQSSIGRPEALEGLVEIAKDGYFREDANRLVSLNSFIKKYTQMLKGFQFDDVDDLTRTLDALIQLLESIGLGNQYALILQSTLHELEIVLEDKCYTALFMPYATIKEISLEDFANKVRVAADTRLAKLRTKMSSPISQLALKLSFYLSLIPSSVEEKRDQLNQLGDLLFYLDLTSIPINAGSVDSNLQKVIKATLGGIIAAPGGNVKGVDYYDAIVKGWVKELAGAMKEYHRIIASDNKEEAEKDVVEWSKNIKLKTKAFEDFFHKCDRKFLNDGTLNQSLLDMLTKLYEEFLTISNSMQIRQEKESGLIINSLFVYGSKIIMLAKLKVDVDAPAPGADGKTSKMSALRAVLSFNMQKLLASTDVLSSRFIDWVETLFIDKNDLAQEIKDKDHSEARLIAETLLSLIDLGALCNELAPTIVMKHEEKADEKKIAGPSFYKLPESFEAYVVKHDIHKKRIGVYCEELSQDKNTLDLLKHFNGKSENVYKRCIAMTLQHLQSLRSAYPRATKLFPILLRATEHLVKLDHIGNVEKLGFEELAKINKLYNELKETLARNPAIYQEDNNSSVQEKRNTNRHTFRQLTTSFTFFSGNDSKSEFDQAKSRQQIHFIN